MKSEKKPIDFALPLRHFVGILFFFVIAVTCLQVISRYVFNNPLIWSEESVRFMVVWMCMVGSAVSKAADMRLDNRVLFSAGNAARELKILGEDVKIILAIPLSASKKSP